MARREFRLADDMYAQDSIELLKQSGINFAQNEARGIEVQRFGEVLMSSGIVLNDEVRSAPQSQAPRRRRCQLRVCQVCVSLRPPQIVPNGERGVLCRGPIERCSVRPSIAKHKGKHAHVRECEGTSTIEVHELIRRHYCAAFQWPGAHGQGR